MSWTPAKAGTAFPDGTPVYSRGTRDQIGVSTGQVLIDGIGLVRIVIRSRFGDLEPVQPYTLSVTPRGEP